jgi:hypothetical protein
MDIHTIAGRLDLDTNREVARQDNQIVVDDYAGAGP